MFELDTTLPAEIVPLSWLLGIWEGSGIIAYRVGDETREHEFGQRVAFTQDGTPHIQYSSSTWLFGDAEEDEQAIRSEFPNLTVTIESADNRVRGALP